jgi:hypothetical protein
LKDDKYHDFWHRSFNTQAVAQDVADFCDETDFPTTVDNIALFSEKQTFVYAVLEIKVQTNRGKAIIRDHEHDFDAQKVYKKHKNYHLKSTKANFESSVILSYITSAKLGDRSRNGTTEAFIIHWQNQVRLYEKHGPPTDHFSDGQKRIVLQNSVNGVDELRQVKNTADHMGATFGTMLTYAAYITLLFSAASAYDDQFKPKRSKRHVLLHDIQDYYDDHDYDVPLILILPLTLNVLLVPSKPMQLTFNLNLLLNLILPRLGCHLKNGLAWMPPASLSGIVLMIR